MRADYVIAGAGSAGCVLANRLSEDPDVRVLLLEAGGEARHMNVATPAAFPKLFKSERDWNYECAPQEHAGGRSFYLPRGRMLGGSSSMNAMLYVRGHRADYDEWAELADERWSYRSVLPYFKRSESQQRFRDEYHGQDGPMHVSDQRDPRPLAHVFVEAATGLGYPGNEDFNGAEQEGIGYYQATQRNGQRESTETAFLRPARGRPNLEVVTGAQVARIIFEAGRAQGVQCVDGRSFAADREVILSAGAYGSPHLLMLSGIGDPMALRDHGIEVQAENPGVGQNLQEHVYAMVIHRCSQNATLDLAETFPAVLANLFRYFASRKGPFTSVVAESGGFVRTDAGLAAPDLQFHFAPVFFIEHAQVIPGGCGYSLAPTLLRPESRGEVRLASADPTRKPIVDPRYLSAAEDVKTLVEGFKIGRAILDSKPFAAFKEREHQPERHLETDGEIEAYVRRAVDHIYHPVGTCRMGNDDASVVDPELNVRGVAGLRVVDASVMPAITRGNTNAPTIMIAERAADLIKETAGST